MSVYMGDFLGFRLGDEHTYNLNITRVSTNNRYSDTLLPSFNDITASVPGQTGMYYWNTQYTTKNFNIDFAFDDLRDEDIRNLQHLLDYKGVKPIIFDEYPYKKYYVKVAAPPNIRYICFDKQEFRIYKGEGNINFIAYYPFGIGVVAPKITNDVHIINNTGDLPAELEIIYAIADLNEGLDVSLQEKSKNNALVGELHLASVSSINNDVYIKIDTRTQLIEGLDAQYQKTGNLYNRFISSGDFFHAPLGTTDLISSVNFNKAVYNLLYY